MLLYKLGPAAKSVRSPEVYDHRYIKHILYLCEVVVLQHDGRVRVVLSFIIRLALAPDGQRGGGGPLQGGCHDLQARLRRKVVLHATACPNGVLCNV